MLRFVVLRVKFADGCLYDCHIKKHEPLIYLQGAATTLHNSEL